MPRSGGNLTPLTEEKKLFSPPQVVKVVLFIIRFLLFFFFCSVVCLFCSTQGFLSYVLISCHPLPASTYFCLLLLLLRMTLVLCHAVSLWVSCHYCQSPITVLFHGGAALCQKAVERKFYYCTSAFRISGKQGRSGLRMAVGHKHAPWNK